MKSFATCPSDMLQTNRPYEMEPVDTLSNHPDIFTKPTDPVTKAKGRK